MKVDVALIPAAGRGTRMRPATNAVPKALLTVVDKPSIQWVVEEAAAAGVSEAVVVVDPDAARMVDRHFDMVGHLPSLKNVMVRTVIQQDALGLGHAVLTGREAIGDRPFFVLTADDLISPDEAVLPHLANAAGPGLDTSVLCLRQLPEEVLVSKGVVLPGKTGGAKTVSKQVIEVGGAVEKPLAGQIPSPYGIQGRYLFTPEVFGVLQEVSLGYGGEMQLTDAVDVLGRQGRCRGWVTNVEFLDTGFAWGFLHATFVLAAASPDYGEELKTMIKKLMEG